MSIFAKKKLGALLLCAALPMAALAQDEVYEDDVEGVHEDGALPQMTVETAPVQMDVALNCAFALECYEGEACGESGFGFLLDGHGGGFDETTVMMEAMISTEAGDVFLMGARDAGTYVLSGGGFEARHMLTVSDAGDARYTVHYAEGPQVISYIGRCEVAQ